MRVLRRAARGAKGYVVELVTADATLSRLIAIYALAQLAIACWDLPSSFSWENDGIAPRDLFGGFAFNLTPGKGHRYPLLHYLIVGVFSLPALLLAVVAAPEYSLEGIRQSVLDVPAMTAVSLVAKGVAVAMGCLMLLTLARIARRLHDRAAGRFAVAFAVASISIPYYGRASNLDGPYMCWTVLALDRLLDVIERGRQGDYGWFAVLTAAAVATKDQAYASFVLPGVGYLIAVPLVRPGALSAGSAHAARLARAVGIGALALLALGGGLWNPTGFVARLAMLTGPNSQDWRNYPATGLGLLQNIRDLAASAPSFSWPWPLLALALAGVIVSLASRGQRLQRALPLVAGVSSTVFFTLVVARCDHRFVLPLSIMLCVYGGVACAALWRRAGQAGLPAMVAPALLTALLGLSALRGVALAATQWGDARRQVEAWLAELPRGSVVETYGLLVYLPRFDTSDASPYSVVHIGPRFGVFPGIEHRDEPYAAIAERKPAAVVIPEAFARRFLPDVAPAGVDPKSLDRDSRAFFRGALSGSLPGYRLALHATPRLPTWLGVLGLQPIEIQGSTGQATWVYERAR